MPSAPGPDEFVATVRERLAWCTATAEALDGGVRVTVAPGGSLTALDLTQAVLDRGAGPVAAAVLDAVTRASAQAAHEFDVLAGSVLGTGPDSALAWLPEPGSVLSGHLPGPDGEYLRGVTGHGSAAEGQVTVTTGPGGALTGLRIAPGLRLDDPMRVAAAIRAALSSACGSVARELVRRRREAGPDGPIDLDAVLDRAAAEQATGPKGDEL